MSIICKKCSSDKYVKSGTVRKKQRYLCKECGCNFTEGDGRKNDDNQTIKALCILLYSLSKGTFRCLSEIFQISHTTVYRWVRAEAEKLPEPEIHQNIQEVEIDEMWHFLDLKKTKNGSSRQWIARPATPLPGLSVVVILQQQNDSTKRSST